MKIYVGIDCLFLCNKDDDQKEIEDWVGAEMAYANGFANLKSMLWHLGGSYLEINNENFEIIVPDKEPKMALMINRLGDVE